MEKHQSETQKCGGVQQSKHHEQHHNPPAATPPPPPPPPSSSSTSSSPSHDFSFAISLHPSAPNSPPSKSPGKTKPDSPLLLDLSPADEIFSHGHLLPLHLPVSPRSSINSKDKYTLPVKENELSTENNTRTAPNGSHHAIFDTNCQERTLLEDKVAGKSKSFSLFGLPRCKKEREANEKGYQEGQKRKSKFDVSRFLQKYVRLIKPFVSSRRDRRADSEIHHRKNQSMSSGNLKLRSGLKGLRGGRDFSSPASVRNSPANSGHLMASGNITPANKNNTGESTMEELQAAIQAAIAHCKKSIDEKDKN